MENARLAIGSATLVLIVVIANIFYGTYRLNQDQPESAATLNLLVIQTNLPQSNKMKRDPQQQQEDLFGFAQVTVNAAAEIIASQAGTPVPPDLIVWPETMVPGHGFDPQTLKFLEENNLFPGRQWLDLLLEVRRITGAPLLVGSPTRLGLGVTGEGEDQHFTWEHSYNSAYLIDRDQPPFARYDKILLTPFGETMPYISNWAWLESALLALGAQGMSFDLDAAEEIARLTLPTEDGEFVLATPICYEDTVPRVCRRLVYHNGKKADALLNISNDGWFGWSDAGREAHALFARFRTIENRVPLVRAVNTGISMYVDSSGKVIERLTNGRNQGGGVQSMYAKVELDERITLYSRIGNLLPALCFGLTVAAVLSGIIAGWRLRRIHRSGDK